MFTIGVHIQGTPASEVGIVIGHSPPNREPSFGVDTMFSMFPVNSKLTGSSTLPSGDEVWILENFSCPRVVLLWYSYREPQPVDEGPILRGEKENQKPLFCVKKGVLPKSKGGDEIEFDYVHAFDPDGKRMFKFRLQ